MTPEASAPIYPTPNATPLTLEATFCDKAKREILRFGVELVVPSLCDSLAESLCAVCRQRLQVGEKHRGLRALESELRPVV